MPRWAVKAAVLEPQRDPTRQRRMVSSDTIAAGQTVTSTYTSKYTTKTGAAFTDAAPSNSAKAGPLRRARRARNARGGIAGGVVREHAGSE